VFAIDAWHLVNHFTHCNTMVTELASELLPGVGSLRPTLGLPLYLRLDLTPQFTPFKETDNLHGCLGPCI